jgi:hypothetical protein
MFTHGNNCMKTIKSSNNIHIKTIITRDLNNLVKQMNYE